MQEDGANWTIAVFAHNEATNIAACIDSIVNAAGQHAFRIYVLANGCSDDTASVVARKQAATRAVSLVTIELADKANAWNHYVHGLASAGATHFFVDGDVTLDGASLQRLDDYLRSTPIANAAAAVPENGRGKTDWIRRMIRHGRVSGGLYALQGAFVEYLRGQRIRIPVGLIGDDFLVSAFAKGIPAADAIYRANEKLGVVPDATFRFQSISGRSPSALRAYLRRLIRYRVRSYQLGMVFDVTATHGFQALPANMLDLYREAPRLPGYYWRGAGTLIDWLAVTQIRKAAKHAQA